MENEEVQIRKDREATKEKTVRDDFAADVDMLKSYTGLNPNFRRKLTRIEKAAEVQQAGTKQLIPAQTMSSAYGMMDVVIPPYNLDELANFYESNTANHSSVKAKVSNYVGLGYSFEITQAVMQKLEDATSDNALKNAHKRIETSKLEMIDWLENLNPVDTFTHILEKAMIDYESVGNGYIEISRTVTGEIGYIGHIPATTVRVRRLNDGYVQIVNQNVVFFRNFQDSKTANPISSDHRPNELIHLKQYTPKNGYYGVPDMVPAAVAIVGDQLAGRYNLDYFENKAVPRYIVTLKGAKLSAAAQEELFRFLQAGLKGQNHRTLYIPLPSDSPDNKVEFKMEPIENGIQEGSFGGYRKDNRDEVLMAHQMPISKIGSASGVSIAAALAADRTFKEQVARPVQRTLEKRLNKIVKEKTNMFTMKLNELDLTDENTQSQIDERYLKTQVLVPNEVRDRLGKPMRTGGEEPLKLTGQQAAENNANRTRDAERTNNASDSAATATGRNAQGEGRKQP